VSISFVDVVTTPFTVDVEFIITLDDTFCLFLHSPSRCNK
jgi:hypothetical protein